VRLFSPRDYSVPGAKRSDFWSGAFLWLAFNIVITIVLNVLWGSLPKCGPYGESCVAGQWLGVIGLVANVAYFIVVGKDRPWLAFGAVGCIGVVFAAGLVLAAFTALVCGSGF